MPVLDLLFSAPYGLGYWFVGFVRTRGGVEAVDAAIQDPPPSDEQVVDPVAFLHDERPKDVRVPRLRAGETKRGGSDELGVLGLYVVLASSLDPRRGSRAIASLNWSKISSVSSMLSGMKRSTWLDMTGERSLHGTWLINIPIDCSGWGIINVPHPLVFRRFATRDFEQMRRSWYVFFFQLPWLPEMGMRAGDWRGAVRALRGSAKSHTFTDEDIHKYKEAWSQPGAMTAMINWYRAVRYQTKLPDQMQIKVPTLKMWGMKDVALSHRMARPSIDHCENGKLILFPDSTHWVQQDAAEEVNHYLIDFLLGKGGKQASDQDPA